MRPYRDPDYPTGLPRHRITLVKGYGKQYPVGIDFKEDCAGGADWTIKK
jgi:hypothetical protein